MERVDVVIVGAGISGMHAAHLLIPQHRSVVVLEARERIGGRILSPEYEGFFADLGPSWYWPQIHSKMANLIREFGLEGYRQYETGQGRFQHPDGAVFTIPGFNMEPLSWRLCGGMAALVSRLWETIPPGTIRLQHPVCRIEKQPAGVLVSVGELEKPPRCRLQAEQVILALPPRLAAATILFEPELSHELTQEMLRIGTWMADQAKFCAFYEEPFWRETGLSGQGFSQRGPLGEIHDGSNDGRGPYGLTGFVGIPPVQRRHPRALAGAIVSQLSAIFGQPAGHPTTFFYQDWALDPFTATQYDQHPMREHPDYHPPAGKTSIWQGRIHFAGTETALEHGGYLEGALSAAERAASAIG